jgi:hypothetical protein
MSITEHVQKLVVEKSAELSKDEQFKQLQEFYQEMQKAGVALKQPYSLPQRDTVGKRLHQLRVKRTE